MLVPRHLPRVHHDRPTAIDQNYFKCSNHALQFVCTRFTLRYCKTLSKCTLTLLQAQEYTRDGSVYESHERNYDS